MAITSESSVSLIMVKFNLSIHVQKGHKQKQLPDEHFENKLTIVYVQMSNILPNRDI